MLREERARRERAEAERDAAVKMGADGLARYRHRAEQAEAVVVTLREWMAEYPGDKYTGAWWLAELDRIAALRRAGEGA